VYKCYDTEPLIIVSSVKYLQSTEVLTEEFKKGKKKFTKKLSYKVKWKTGVKRTFS